MDALKIANSLNEAFKGKLTAEATDRGSIVITFGKKSVEIDAYGNVHGKGD